MAEVKIERLREKETVTVNPAPIILVEGMLVLENEELCDLMGLVFLTIL